MSRLDRLRVVGILVLVALFVWSYLGGNSSGYVSLTGHTMGTTYLVKLRAEGLSLEEIGAKIQAALDHVEARMSTYRDDSELSRFNRSDAGMPFHLSESTLTVLETALDVGRASGGAFDVTVAPLVDAWGFGPLGPVSEAPESAVVDSLLQFIGEGKLTVDRAEATAVRLHPGVRCDLSAIAKGYAVDQVAELLESEGGTDYLVEVGGEVRTRGRNSRGARWEVAIELPDPLKIGVQTVVPLPDLALATSGGYRNYFENEGRTYTHTLDPRTGRPITHDLASVSVMHDHCLDADAWATALQVLGPSEGLRRADSLGIAALFVQMEGSAFHEFHSRRWREILP